MESEKKEKISSPILLVSDLDDTIKISHTQSKLITVYRGLFRSSAFTGMAQLYDEILLSHPGSEFHIVSSSPPPIRKKIEKFLELNKFPPAKILLRDWIRDSNIFKYKFNSIRQLANHSHCPLILIGDDTEHDPEVFSQIAIEQPEKVLARYLRVVKGRPLPEGSHGFFTAFDIACAELAAGRLKSDQVLRVGEAVLLEARHSRLIPWFSLKPPLDFLPFLSSPEQKIVDLWERISAKIQAIPRRQRKK